MCDVDGGRMNFDTDYARQIVCVCAFNVSAFGWLGHVFYGFYLVCLHRKKTPLFAKRLPHFLTNKTNDMYFFSSVFKF